jgi:cytosine/adenosine deaminase-related metal-dependent hydrolase
MILRAKVILPVSAPPIEDGVVFFAGNKIRSVARWRDLRAHLRAKAIDLGEIMLLPGLVNAHCHLDYTDMAGELPPTKSFTDWIVAITALRGHWSHSDFSRSWLRGAHQLLQTGTTTVADIESMPDLLPEFWDSTPLRIFSFLEMTGIKSRRYPKEILCETIKKIDSLRHPRNRAALSPHAPYSTLPELLRLTAKTIRQRNWRATIHVAESEQEFEMFTRARGKMHTWLARHERDNSDCGLGSPVAHLARNRLLGANVLAVHANYLARGDALLLAKSKTHVVHCPRSHDYFRHAKFERKRLAAAGVNICLGTDSLATTRKTGKQKPELDMFAEMRTLAANDGAVSPKEILQMATVNGARALGLAGKLGEISPNAFADLIALPCPKNSKHIHDAVVHHEGGVAASVIGGRWAIQPK